MRRASLAALSLSLLALPITSLAAFSLPSELIDALNGDASPRTFNAEAHGSFDGTYFSAWVKGEAQGNNPMTAKGKFWVSVHVSDGKETQKMRIQAVVADKTVYFRATTMSAAPAGMPAWSSVSLHDQGLQGQNPYETLQLQLREEGIVLTEAQVKDIVWSVIDAVLALRSAQNDINGIDYSVKIQPQFLKRLTETIAVLKQRYPSLTGSEAWGELDTTPTAAEIKEVEDFVAKAVNFHLKVMTNAQGVVTGQKVYLAAEVAQFRVVVVAETALKNSPVTVIPPRNAVPVDQLLNEGFDSSLYGVTDAKNAQRSADVNTILNAVYQYAIDHDGTLPPTIPVGAAKQVCRYSGTVCAGMVDLSVLTEDGTYLWSLPADPGLNSTAIGTGYWIVLNPSTGRVTVEARLAEDGETISVTR